MGQERFADPRGRADHHAHGFPIKFTGQREQIAISIPFQDFAQDVIELIVPLRTHIELEQSVAQHFSG
jgi:hypothetical protein